MNTIVDSFEKIKLKISSLKPIKPVNIIAVSKTFTLDHINPLVNHGHLHFGENKVQEAIAKWSNLKKENQNLKLHMIGKLQTNKVKFAVKIFDFIHSVDNLKLAKKIKSEQDKINRNLKLFIQVNIGNEKQKNGILETELDDFYHQITKDLKLDVIGLMCIPPINDASGKYFKTMKQLNQKFNFHKLSMGMSSDYLNAIKFGSTHVRIGTKIFGIRD